MEPMKKSDVLIMGIILIIVFLLYPWFVKTKNGVTTCSNILGFEYKCKWKEE